jgi:hypothetical protein
MWEARHVSTRVLILAIPLACAFSCRHAIDNGLGGRDPARAVPRLEATVARRTTEEGARAFVASVVTSYLDGRREVSFPAAERIVTLDNGSALSRAELQEAWPRLCQIAFSRSVTVEEYFHGVDLKVVPFGTVSPLGRRFMEAYEAQKGDLFVDGSRVKEDVADFIGYRKGFIFVIRKVKGVWTLMAIGG